jgi:hypothetical protein
MNADGVPCHDYEVPNPACPYGFVCSKEELDDYHLRFQYPGQWPWNPVQNQGSYTVFPFQLAPLLGRVHPLLIPSSILLDEVLSPLGPIRVDFSPNGSTITNRTEITHIFYNGVVDNTLIQGPGGNFIMISHGAGTNSSIFWARVNQQIGPPTFEIVNGLMLTYIAVDKTIGILPGGR